MARRGDDEERRRERIVVEIESLTFDLVRSGLRSADGRALRDAEALRVDRGATDTHSAAAHLLTELLERRPD